MKGVLSSFHGNEAAESETVMEKAELRKLDVGQHLRYCDRDRKWFDALVTAIHGEPRYVNESHGDFTPCYPCLNLVLVVDNEEQQDQYGRQTLRETSIMHYQQFSASGFFWCYPDEEEDAWKHVCESLSNIKS